MSLQSITTEEYIKAFELIEENIGTVNFPLLSLDEECNNYIEEEYVSHVKAFYAMFIRHDWRLAIAYFEVNGGYIDLGKTDKSRRSEQAKRSHVAQLILSLAQFYCPINADKETLYSWLAPAKDEEKIVFKQKQMALKKATKVLKLALLTYNNKKNSSDEY